MASPTQTVVDKGIPTSLTAEGLLKILRDLFPLPLQNPLPIPIHGMVRPQKGRNCFSSEIITKSNLSS